MFFEGDFAFRDEGTGHVAFAFADGNAALESVRFWETQAEGNDQDGRTGTKPIQRSPAMGGGIDEATGEGCSEQITKSVALLKHARDQATCFRRAVFDGCGRSIAIQTTHCNAKERAHCQELLVGLAKAGAQLEDDEEEVVDDKGPLATISICSDTEYGGSDRSEHEDEGDSPGDVCIGLAEGLGQVCDSEGDGKEVEGVPGPCQEGDEEEKPLLSTEQAQEADRIGCLCQGWAESGNASSCILSCTHLRLGGVDLGESGLGVEAFGIVLVVGRHGAGNWALDSGQSRKIEGEKRAKSSPIEGWRLSALRDRVRWAVGSTGYIVDGVVTLDQRSHESWSIKSFTRYRGAVGYKVVASSAGEASCTLMGAERRSANHERDLGKRFPASSKEMQP